MFGLGQNPNNVSNEGIARKFKRIAFKQKQLVIDHFKNDANKTKKINIQF